MKPPLTDQNDRDLISKFFLIHRCNSVELMVACFVDRRPQPELLLLTRTERQR